jgi:prophage DNA circulation protein
MSWRTSYRQGAFRGVPFRTADREQSGGRRGEWHEFPQSDVPYFEDLGRKGREFTLNCWVAGDDYQAQRDALIAALEAPGPGTLIDPFRGEMTVGRADYSCSESGVDGGIAEFSIRFAETSGTPAPSVSAPDSATLARGVAITLKAGAPARFAARFSTAGLPGFIEDEAVKLVAGVALAVQIAAAPLGGLGATLHAFDAGLRLLPESARSLVRQPLLLAQSLVGLISALAVLAPDTRRRAAAARAVMRYGETLEPVSGTTPPRLQQAINQAAITGLVQSVAAAELVSALADSDFASYQEAASARGDTAVRIDAIADSAADVQDDDGWLALRSLRTASVRDLTSRGATLARIYRYQTRMTEPALVIARRLYDTTAELDVRAEDLIARNRLHHPGFVPGGITLDVFQEVAA